MSTTTPSFTGRPAALAALALACALALSACGSLAPAHQRPAPELPDRWPTAAAQAASTPATAAQPLAWQDLITEPRLRDTVALALERSPGWRQSLLAVEQSRAALGSADAARWPSVRATLSQTASRTPAEASSSGVAVNSRVDSAALGFSAFELDLFGRLRDQQDAARQTLRASEQTLRSAQLTLVAEVANAWLTLRADQALLALAERTLAAQQDSLALVQRRAALGADSALTLAQSQTSLETARRDRASAASQVQQDLNALRLLLGTDLPEALRPEADDSAQSARLVAVPEGLPSERLRQRPDVQAAEHALYAADASLGAARAARWPSLSLTASAGTASRGLSQLFQGGAWSLVPSLSLPLLDGGALASAERSAELTRDSRALAYEQAVQTAFREVADALAVREGLTQRLAAQQGVVDAARRTLVLAQARWKAGAISHLEVLDAQRSAYSAEQALVSLRLAEQSNRLTLFKVLGGTAA